LRQVKAPVERRSTFLCHRVGNVGKGRVTQQIRCARAADYSKGDIMSMMTLLIVAAAFCVVGSLVLGIAAMANHGVVGHRTSAQWMTMRIVFQGLALGLILLALLTG
jgi:hypothetical protein